MIGCRALPDRRTKRHDRFGGVQPPSARAAALGDQVGALTERAEHEVSGLLFQGRGMASVAGLIVGRHRGRLFGYEYARRRRGPALVRGIVRPLHRDVRYAPWEQVESVDREVGLRVRRDDLTSIYEISPE